MEKDGKGKTQVVKTPSRLSLSIGAIPGRAAILSVRTLMTSMIRQRFEGLQKLFIVNQKPCSKHCSQMIFFLIASI